MLVETGEKIFCLSLDTGKQSGNISTPELVTSVFNGSLTQNFSDLCTGLHSSLPDLTSASYSSKVLRQKKWYDEKKNS